MTPSLGPTNLLIAAPAEKSAGVRVKELPESAGFDEVLRKKSVSDEPVSAEEVKPEATDASEPETVTDEVPPEARTEPQVAGGPPDEPQTSEQVGSAVVEPVERTAGSEADSLEPPPLIGTAPIAAGELRPATIRSLNQLLLQGAGRPGESRLQQHPSLPRQPLDHSSRAAPQGPMQEREPRQPGPAVDHAAEQAEHVEALSDCAATPEDDARAALSADAADRTAGSRVQHDPGASRLLTAVTQAVVARGQAHPAAVVPASSGRTDPLAGLGGSLRAGGGRGVDAASRAAASAPLTPHRGPASNFASQLSRGVAAAIRQGPGVGGGGGSVTIRLNPQALGQLKISIDLEGGGEAGKPGGTVSARFEAGNAEARRLLDESLPALREALGARGLDVGELAVAAADMAPRPDDPLRELGGTPYAMRDAGNEAQDRGGSARHGEGDDRDGGTWHGSQDEGLGAEIDVGADLALLIAGNGRPYRIEMGSEGAGRVVLDAVA